MTGRNSFRHFPNLLRPLSPLIFSVLLSGCVASKMTESARESVKGGFEAKLMSSETIDGSVMLVRVSAASPLNAVPVAEYEGVKFPLYEIPSQSGREFEGVFAVPFAHKSETTQVVVIYGENRKELSLLVKDGNYPSERLKAAGRFINPRKKDLIRIKKDQAEVGEIYRRITEKKYWKGPFVLPIDSAITSIFGTKRVFNGKMNSFHGGLDLRAPVGTPIHAAAPGVVVLAKDLFFTGNTVMIDHGYGVVTIYAHMSKLNVKVGQEVDAKMLLGLSGKTGRVSGPHLHWQAVIHHTKVNPVDLTKVMQ